MRATASMSPGVASRRRKSVAPFAAMALLPRQSLPDPPSAPRREARDVAHLAARARRALVVEMELGHGLAQRVAPLRDLVAEQILHHRVGMALGRAQRQAADGAH